MKRNNKGFTLAELLIVVAIIAVLAAIAIPTFTGQVERAREAADAANLRAAYAQATAQYLEKGSADAQDVTITQTDTTWTTGLDKQLPFKLDGTMATGACTITFDFSNTTKRNAG